VRGKPGDPGRMPPLVAPYHLRLGWLMWFEAMAPSPHSNWFLTLLAGLLKGDPGTVFRVTCPAGCNAQKPVIYGSDPYAGFSSVCVAAIHAGLASDDGGGAFLLTLEDAKPAYRGSMRNGVESHDYGSFDSSFRFRR